MSRRCSIDASKGVQTGNNVSHSHRKTRRRFLPNIQKVSMLSEALGQFVSFKASASSIRTIEHNDGLDNYLLNTSNSKLADGAKKLKKRILKALEKKSADKKAA